MQQDGKEIVAVISYNGQVELVKNRYSVGGLLDAIDQLTAIVRGTHVTVGPAPSANEEVAEEA